MTGRGRERRRQIGGEKGREKGGEREEGGRQRKRNKQTGRRTDGQTYRQIQTERLSGDGCF